MDAEVSRKLEDLLKYVPYIDFLLGIDREKYNKFKEIKEWIVQKRRLPIVDLNTIEQSMITSYKNMVLLDKKIPIDVAKIFTTDVKQNIALTKFVNLCSDDEEEEDNKEKEKSQTKSLIKPQPSRSGIKSGDRDDDAVKKSRRKSLIEPEPSRSGIKSDDSDDDVVEIVSSTLPNKSNKPQTTKLTTTKPATVNNGDESVDGATPKLNQVDNITWTNSGNTSNEPEKSGELLENLVDIKEEMLFQRRPPKTECSATNNKSNDMPADLRSTCNTIVLDSSDEETENCESNTKLEADSNKGECNNNKLEADSNKGECNNNKAEVQFEKLTTQDMFKIIATRLKDMNYEQLQTIYQQENPLPSSSSSECSDQNEALSRKSPVPVAPLKEKQFKSPDKLLTALYDVIDKMTIKPGPQEQNIAPANNLLSNTSPVQYQQQLHYPQQPQQYVNYYNSIPIQTSMCHQAVTQPMYPHGGFTYVNQNAVTPYNPAVSQTLSAVQGSFKTRDPRAKGSLYQNSMQIIEVEMQKRLSMMRANDCPQSQPQPIFMHNNAFHSIQQPMATPAVTHQQQQQQCYRMSASIGQPNRPTHQRQRYAPDNHAPISAQAKTYGEYKRRKTEEFQRQSDENKKRAEEESRQSDENKKRTEKESSLLPKQSNEKKNRAEQESILLNILEPYKDKIEECFKANAIKPNTTSEKPKYNSQDSKNSKTEQHKSRINGRMNRLYKNMECTVKGYDILPNTSGKRRSSIHARSIISEQLNSSQEWQTMDDKEYNASVNKGKRRNTLHASQFDVSIHNLQPNTSSGKRRSSMHARSLISEQSKTSQELQTMDDKEHNASVNKGNRRFSSHVSQSNLRTENNLQPVEKKRRLQSSSVYNSTETSILVSDDEYSVSNSEMTDFEKFRISKTNKLKELIIKRQPTVVLQRLTEEKIQRHTKMLKSVLDVHLIETGVRSDKSHDRTNVTASAATKPSLKIINNDCRMTERNAKFCVLCSSKPADLTNHYKRKHKCESYVSRLTWEELDELCINTPFAKLTSSKNSRIECYEVLCPFCNKIIKMSFMELYSHYSSHTGEYAFHCSGCQLHKPFRDDIKKHIKSAKKHCKYAQVDTIYRYPSNTMCIYLHYCIICNFVQLNEANVFKHLREHHDTHKATADAVRKCILAAISVESESSCLRQDVETTNIAAQPEVSTGKSTDDKEIKGTLAAIAAPSEAKLEINPNLDDNIAVFNEACEEDLFDLEDRLKQLHEGQITEENAPLLPMTVIHLNSQSVSNAGGVDYKNEQPQYKPGVFKTETIEVEENLLPTSPRISTISKISYTKNFASHSNYREYPSNVNYLGFYKCMDGDCFYSSDASEEFVKHMEGHQQDNLYINFLCPYCILPVNSCQTLTQLVEHLKLHHANMVYQCSMCCYRSCEALYVLIHQRENHPPYLEKCSIYKCSGEEKCLDFNYIKDNMTETISKVKCPYCSNSYYNTHILMLHMGLDHNSEVQKTIRRYSCVYCSFWDNHQFPVKKHIATHHPGELPYLVDHNLTTVTEDALDNLEPLCFSEPVTIREVTRTYDAKSIDDVTLHENNEVNIKPSVEDLIRCQAELLKVRLRKLTEKSGVPSCYLYRCTDQTCGGFFSIFSLWLRHMRVRHACMETQCPHCTVQTTKSLEEFAFHFEEHRLHTYICFHCPLTTSTAEKAQDHWLKEHSELGQMHVEKIPFNLNYSYYIMMQSNKFQNKMEFLSSMSKLLDCRIQELKDNEASKLKTMWLVANTPFSQFLEDFPKHVLSPKVLKKCFHNNCDFRSNCDDTLFNHIRSNHDIAGSAFKCIKCDFRLDTSPSWDAALTHIKQHTETSCFVCGACNKYFLCRTKISDHIRSEHSARDVPVANLTKRAQSIYAKLAIVFANDHLTFSTMRNCFVCEEQSMRGNSFMLHLKRYHNFVVSYFCEWCNLHLDSLFSAEKHFNQNHTINKMKIRCELASKDNLSILSLNEFKIEILSDLDGINRHSPVIVKMEEESDDDSLIIMEDDDVIVENFEKSRSLIDESSGKPKLKCIAMESLIDSNTTDRLRVLPIAKCINSPLDYNNKTKTSDTEVESRNITDTVISSQRLEISSPFIQPAHTSMSNPRTYPCNTVKNAQGIINITVPASNTVGSTVNHGNISNLSYTVGSTVNHGNISNLSYTVGSTVNHGNISNLRSYPGQNVTDPGIVVTTLGGAITSHHISNANTLIQSTAKGTSNRSCSTIANVRLINSASVNGPKTTSFLNSQCMLPPAPSNTATANSVFPAGIENTSNISSFRINNTTVRGPAPFQHSVMQRLQPPNYVVSTNAATPLNSPAMIPNFPSSTINHFKG